MFAERQAQILLAKPNLLLLKKFKCESLVFLNKSLKHEKYFNMVSAEAPSSTKHVLSHSED
jgi:hypothetical protein